MCNFAFVGVFGFAFSVLFVVGGMRFGTSSARRGNRSPWLYGKLVMFKLCRLYKMNILLLRLIRSEQ